MKHTNINFARFLAVTVLPLYSLSIYAEESQKNTSMNKDQVDGRVGEVKGKVKEVTGQILGDKPLEIEGHLQKNIGKAQAEFGDIKKDIKKGK